MRILSSDNILMINRYNLILLLGLSFSLNALSQSDITNYEIPPFKRIKLMGNINVVCVVDTSILNTVENFDTITYWDSGLFLKVQNETLTIQISEKYATENLSEIEDTEPLTLRVSPDLKEIENGYSSTLYVKGNLVTTDLKVKLSGNGAIHIDSIQSPQTSLFILTGKGKIDVGTIFSEHLSCRVLGTGGISVDNGACKELKCKTVGTGKMDFTGLKSQIAIIKYAGGGYIKCHPVKTFTASGIGTTEICYLGNPNITRKGNVKLHRMNE